ncbi:hypothetical protein AGDE_15070 [Angomonas deanei]|uniref:Uncharacterized protein n=1 Tax=Angomonas deanei TaxID=59799 RepID=A0A7G2CSE2_9TRYP|nr:hypothetical protein AGDE_15070 [Angomonas deanei]CAD2221122.1 hypothetical protein, conserved [Angomonas deanei]|eukprot:EPY19729.1 hypothetical protein AGDE_15070 [Angomonas deanei]
MKKLVLLLCFCVLLFCAGGASLDNPTFRCQQPLSRVVFHAKPDGHHCDLHYFSIDNASARVSCGVSSNETTCKVSLHFNITTADDLPFKFIASIGEENLNGTSDGPDTTLKGWARDIWRYNVALRSLSDGTTIHYDGDDGYSVCCDLFGEDRCGWEERVAGNVTEAVQTVKHCELPSQGNLEGVEGKRHIAASLVKPLHRLAVGQWEARVTLWRERMGDPSFVGKEELGRLIVPFEVREEWCGWRGRILQKTIASSLWRVMIFKLVLSSFYACSVRTLTFGCTDDTLYFFSLTFPGASLFVSPSSFFFSLKHFTEMSSNSVKVSYATKKSVPARTSGSQQKTSETRKVTSKKASRAVPGNTLPSRVDSADVMAASSTESVDSVLAVSALTTPAASEVRAHHKSGAAHRRDPGIRSDPSGDPSTKENAAPTIVKNKPTSGAKPASPPLKIKTNLSTGGTPATSVVGDSPDVGSSCSKKWQWCEDSDQMDAVLSYIADITKAFGTRTRTLPPPSSLDNFRATAIPQGRAKLASSEGGRFPILNKLYDASLSLLRAFSQLEYAKVSHKVNLEEMEKNTLEASSLVESLVESVERKFCMHESEEVREAFGSKHQTVDNCHEVVECLVKVARYIVLLRRLCGQHNVARVVDVLEELDIVVRRGANASKSETSTFYQLSVLKGPFFVFLRERWIPTVREWQVVVDRAMESARMGDFEDAVTVAEAAQLSITHLQDILRPDETVSELHRNYIVNPIEEIRLAGEQRRLILQELKNAMAAPGIRPLAKAIRTAQSTPYFSKTSELSSATESSSYSDDLSLFKEAQQMLINLQQVDSITNALNTVHRISSTDSVALFLVLHRANEQINRLGIAESASHSQKVVRASRPVAAKIREDSGGARAVIARTLAEPRPR